MDDAKRLQLIEAEYFKLQDYVESFDTRALQIKGWSVTVSAAGVVTAYASGLQGQDREMVLWVAAASAIAFWIIEFFWKCFQWSLMRRIDEIEAFMREEAPDDGVAPLQIRASWHRAFKGEPRQDSPETADDPEDKGEIWSSLIQRKMFKPSIALPHAAIALIAAILAVQHSN